MLLEKGEEVRFAEKSAFLAYLVNGYVTSAREKELGVVESAHLHELVRGKSRKVFEISVKLGAADVKALSYVIRRRIQMEVLRNILQHVLHIEGRRADLDYL